MSRLDARLRKLERSKQSADVWGSGQCHLIKGHSREQLAAKEAELKASPEWSENHHLIAIRFVSPGEVRP